MERVTEETIWRVLAAAALGESLSLPLGMGAGGWGSLELGGVLPYGSITESMIILARSLALGCGFNPGLYAEMLAREADLENPLRLYSPATAEALVLVRKGTPWARAREMVTSVEPPVEAAARAAPVALFYRDERLAADMAAAQVFATSPDARVATAARLYAGALHYVLRGLPPSEALAEAAVEQPPGLLRSSVLEALEAPAPPARRSPAEAALAAAAWAAAAAEAGRVDAMEAARLAAEAAGSGDPRAAASITASLLAAAELLEPLGAERLEAAAALREASRLLAEARARCIIE